MTIRGPGSPDAPGFRLGGRNDDWRGSPDAPGFRLGGRNDEGRAGEPRRHWVPARGPERRLEGRGAPTVLGSGSGAGTTKGGPGSPHLNLPPKWGKRGRADAPGFRLGGRNDEGRGPGFRLGGRNDEGRGSPDAPWVPARGPERRLEGRGAPTPLGSGSGAGTTIRGPGSPHPFGRPFVKLRRASGQALPSPVEGEGGSPHLNLPPKWGKRGSAARPSPLGSGSGAGTTIRGRGSPAAPGFRLGGRNDEGRPAPPCGIL